MLATGRKFFISRAGEDAEWGRWIAEVLQRAGHSHFLQDYDMPNGSFVEHIKAGLESHPDFVAVLSPDHLRKEHCIAELNASYAADPLGTKHLLLLVRVRDCEIPKIFSPLIYLDLRERNAAAERMLLAKIRGERPTVKSTQRTFISKLPPTDPNVFGRDPQLAILDQAWADPATNLIQIIAPGGTGKTALMTKWYKRHLEGSTVFGWSFYSQGSSLDRQTSSDAFFAEMQRFFSISIDPAASVYAKAEAVAARLREERVLLILDGMEPLQDSAGDLRDDALEALLQELSVRHLGLVLCTTRVRITDLPDDAPAVLSIDLDNLDPADGGRYLRHLQVVGPDDELEAASGEFGNHALALTLLGTYLVAFSEADIRRRGEIPDLFDSETRHGAHAWRVMQGYEQMFAGKPELEILRALGYFDRPAEPEALALVRPELAPMKYQAALNRLHQARLILTKDPTADLDCHPLVREYFGARVKATDLAAYQAGHSRLYEHYCGQAEHQPDTLHGMTPLFHAVGHGCEAGRHQEALDAVYRKRIRRDDEAYLIHRLGGFGTNLSLLNHFRGESKLSAEDQVWITSQFGFSLSGVGRFAQAVPKMREAADEYVRLEKWQRAAINFSNLSGLHLILGYIAFAIETANRSVDYADRCGKPFERMARRTMLGKALHQSGDVDGALKILEVAEGIEFDVKHGNHPSLWPYAYHDLLISQAGSAGNGETIERLTRRLKEATEAGWPLDIGLDHVLLGRAHAIGSAISKRHQDQGVEFLRRSGYISYIPLALLARGTDADLAEVERIASRGEMKLHLADYHLAMARRHQSKEHLETAAKLVTETGYHRRNAELAELHSLLYSPR